MRDSETTYGRVLRYINEHIDEDIGIDELVRVSGYSRRHLYRVFRERRGATLAEYIRTQRLMAAAELMLSEQTLLDVALRSGYEPPSGFYKAFYSYYGCSPNDYRKEQNLRRYYMEKQAADIDELDRAIGLDGDNAVLYFRRGLRYQCSFVPEMSRTEALERAVADYEKALTIEQRGDSRPISAQGDGILPLPALYLYLAQAKAHLGMKEAARECFEKSLALEMTLNGVLAYARFLVIEGHDRAYAKKLLARSVEETEDKYEAYANRANFYQMFGEPRKAIADIDKMLELVPNDRNALNRRARAYVMVGDFAAALTDASAALAQTPDAELETHMFITRADIYKNLGQMKKSHDDLRRAIVVATRHDVEEDDILAFIYDKLGEYDNSITEYTRLINKYKDTNQTYRINTLYLSRGNLYRKLALYDEAAADYRKEIELTPDHLGVYDDLADCYMKAGKTDEAFELYSELAERLEDKLKDGGYANTQYAWTFTHRALICATRGEYARSAEFHLKAVDIEPENAFHYYHLVNLCAYHGDAMSADELARFCGKTLEYYDRALGVHERDYYARQGVGSEREWQTRVYRWRAACYEAMGRQDEAEADYARSTELETDKNYVCRFRTSRYLRARDAERAAATAKKALAMLEGAPRTDVTRAYELIADGELDAAIALLRASPETTHVCELLEALDD